MVLLRSTTNLPEGLWRARRLPQALRFVILAVALVGNGVTAWRITTQGPDGFGTVEAELALCALDVLLWAAVALTPSWAWVPALVLQAWLLLADADPGSFTIELLVLMGFVAFAASRAGFLIPLASTVLWTLLLPRTADGVGTALVVAYLALLVIPVVLGLSLRWLLARREQDTATIADFETSTRAALKEQRDGLARELHDIVAHDLTVIAMQASAGAIRTTDPDEKESFTVIGDSARSALDDLRLLLQIMREPRQGSDVEPPSAGIDLAGEIAEVAGQLEELGHRVTTHVDGDLSAVPDGVRTTVRRVLREGTTNVLKHGADRSEVSISTVVQDGQVVTTITSALPQVSDQRTLRHFGRSGFGLIGLRERVQLLRGRLESGPREDGTFVLTVSLPLRPSS